MPAGPQPKSCSTCGRDIAPGEVYYRFTLVLQGEQDVLEGSARGAEEELGELLRQLEQAPEDAQEWEEQIHWERSGVVCATCRSVVVRALTPPPGAAGPH